MGRRLAEAAGGVGDFAEVDVVPAIERSLLVGAGLAPPDVAWALGHTWRTLYPAIVARLGGDGLPARDWPAFLRLAAELERVAFGPPAINAAKLLALVEAGRIDLGNLRGATLRRGAAGIELRSPHGARAVDVALDAVLPGPGAAGAEGLVGDLVAAGCARVAPGRRGLEVTPDGSCRGRDGAVTRGLSAIGRPTEDSVIGNDTLSSLPASPRRSLGAADRAAQPRVLPRERAASRAEGGARMNTKMPVRAELSRVRAGCAGMVPLPARLEPWQIELCGQPDLLARWIEQYGSPLNLLDPTAFARNAGELQWEADRVGADLAIFFARKANKALAFVDEARRIGLGVDVASERELQQALESGIPAADLIVTAAVKPRALLELCVAAGATVTIDNEDELRLLAAVAERGAGSVPVALRLAPAPARGKPPSRFGLTAPATDRARRALLADRVCAAAGDRRRALPPRRLRGSRPRERPG